MVLHVFNPENDLALACFSPHFIPPASARQMAGDLAVLPAWWANGGDAVCVPSAEAACHLSEVVPGLCPAVEWVDWGALPAEAEVDPWGWSRLLTHRLRAGGMHPVCLPDDATLANYRDWSGRRQAVEMLAYLCGTGSPLGREWGGRLCGVSYYCESEADIVRLLAHGSDMILKAPWSGSGKGLRLGRGGYVPPLSGWCRRLLREQGGVVVEPIYNKVYDFALEFYANGHQGVMYTGLSVFLTTVRGTYAGNWVAAEEVKERWLSAWVPGEMWRQLKNEVGAYLHRMFSGGYRGYVGVDMMLCRVPGRAGLCVHPCVEINLRRTMGQVSVDLARLLAPSAEARFAIGYARETGTAWDECLRQRKECPLVMENGKLHGGYLQLTPVGQHTHYHAALWVDSPEKVRPGMVERGFVQDAEGAYPGGEG